MAEYGGYGSDASSIRNPLVVEANGTLKAPTEIVPSVIAARNIYWNLRTEHSPRTLLYAQIEGLIAGNPPYNSAELAAQGLGHIANFNNMDANAMYERTALAYWNLLNQTEYIAKFEVSTPPNVSKDEEMGMLVDSSLVEYGNTMSRHFNDIVRSWKDFNTQFNMASGQHVRLGLSPILWPDASDWRWKTIELSRFFVKDQAPVDTDSMTCWCVESIFTVQALYQIYQVAKEFPNATHWDTDELETFLLFKANSFLKPQEAGIFNMMDLQMRIQNNDGLGTAAFSDEVRLISLLYREYDGKISQYIFDKYWDSGSGKFLFKHPSQYECLEDVMILFTSSPGEFTIHSNKGLGHKIFASSQAIMQLDCSGVDMARWAATPILETPATDPSSADGIRLYPGVPTNIGMAKFANNTLGANVNQIIGMSQYITSKINYNLANSGDDPSMPDKSMGSISDSTALRQAYKEFGILKNSIAHFYTTWDLVIKNMVAKMLHSKKGDSGYEYANEWKQRCISDGVPEIIFSVKSKSKLELNRYLKVKASRVAGDGSDVAMIMGLDQLTPFASSFGARESRNFLKLKITAALGLDYVPELLSAQDDTDMNAGGATIAGLENAIMKGGESPVFSPDNDQKAHFSTHMALGNFVIQSIQQQQMSVLDADTIFNVLIPHLGDHWNTLTKSIFAQAYVQQNMRAWKQLQDYATLNRRNAAQAQQAELKKRQEQEQKTNEAMTDEQIKTMQAQGDERRAEAKSQATITRTKDTADKRGDIMKESARSTAETKRLEVQLKADAANEKTANRENPLANTSTPELRQSIQELNGVTPAPYDIENI